LVLVNPEVTRSRGPKEGRPLIAFRCTAKALKRFTLKPDEDLPEPTGVLGNWYVNLLNAGRHRLVMCVSEVSLLPVILPARNDEFPRRFPEHLFRTLCAVGIADRAAAREAEQAKEYRIGGTASRSVLGVMNDFAFLAKVYLDYHDVFEATLKVAESPSTPIDNSPDRKTRELFAGSA